jgi:hypothetical protein
MANPVKGEAPLVLRDGRQFTLVLDMEALLSVEEATGKPLPQVMAMAGQGFMTAMAAIAQAAFARHHPDLTRADVLAMMTSDQDALSDALNRASETGFPQQSVGGKGGPPPAKPRGKRSGRSGAKPG